jgi:hypothetical protein
MILHDAVAFGAGFVCGALYLVIVVMVGQRLREVQPIE